jgi:uncharacterized protein (TIGR03437 family)
MRVATPISSAHMPDSRLRWLTMTTRVNRSLLVVCGLIAVGGSLPAPLHAQTITSIINAASGVPGGVSPGEIVVLYGTSIGPATLVPALVAGVTTLPTTLGGVSVSFNGIAAPIVYVSASQTAVQVPYELAGSSSASVLVNNGNGTSPAFSIPVVPAAPGLFTLGYSGAGQVVAQSVGGVNSAQNPVPPGTAIVLYATGEGASAPTGVDGVIVTTLTVRQPAQAISVQIAGVKAQVLFAGSVPGDIPGIVEIGVIVPGNLPTNLAAPITLTIGGVTTTQLATLAVQ